MLDEMSYKQMCNCHFYCSWSDSALRKLEEKEAIFSYVEKKMAILNIFLGWCFPKPQQLWEQNQNHTNASFQKLGVKLDKAL